jgi:hypothetical protein
MRSHGRAAPVAVIVAACLLGLLDLCVIVYALPKMTPSVSFGLS